MEASIPTKHFSWLALFTAGVKINVQVVVFIHTPSVSISLQVRKRKEVTKDNKINILVDGETRSVNYTLHVCYCTSIAYRSHRTAPVKCVVLSYLLPLPHL
jgi:hypothetical protein